jgi:hypothetical protein
MDNMTTKRKPAIRAKTKRVYIHKCSEKDDIDHLIKSNQQLSIIITGNGDPEKGLSRQVALISERQKGVLKTLEGVHDELKGVNENHNVLLGEITRVGLQLNEVEKRDERQKIAEDLAEKKKQDGWQRVIWIVMALIGLTGIFLNNIHTSRNSKKIDNLGTPVITNSRGMPTALPNGDQLKMYPRDFTGDTTKVKKTTK